MDKIVFDKVSFKDSVRSIDDNGFLHVAISNITKEQVAPYLGSEIPNFERLGLKPDSIYKVYRPAEELKKAVISSNGIPIQLDHHADFADAPAKETRVGSTGTDGIFNAPYLQNSLHIQDADAIKRIDDGSMRELSLGYRYTPEKKSGVFNGEPYDLIMRDISCNHLALVEEGRAGHDVLVKDSKSTLNEVTNMSDKVEKMEIALADQMISTANMLKDLHKVDAMGNVVDITKDEEISTMEDKLNEFLAKLEEAGIDKDEARAKIEEIIKAKSEVEAEDEDLGTKEEVKEDLGEDDDLTDKEEIESEEDLGEDDDLEEEDKEEEKETLNFDEDQKHGLDACGLDSEDPIVQKAFAEGVKYGEKKEKDIYTKEEVKKLFELLKTAPFKYRMFFTLAVYSGFRRGELCGLEWKDIDWEHSVVNVRRTSNYTKLHGLYTDTTKTKRSVRSSKLPPIIMDMLKEYKEQQDREREQTGDKWVDTDRLFVQWNGQPMYANTPYNWYRRFCKKHDMRFCDVHSLRHFHASLLIFAGVDPVSVSADLGHTAVSTTTSLYCHMFREAQARNCDVIAKALNFDDDSPEDAASDMKLSEKAQERPAV